MTGVYCCIVLCCCYKQTNQHSPLYGCNEWFVRYPLLWQSCTNVRVLLVREGRSYTCLFCSAICLHGLYNLVICCAHTKGSPALEYQSPSEAQMPGCKPLLRSLLYRPFPSWFRSHVRACRGRTCWLRSPELWRCPRRVLAWRSQGRVAWRA